MGQASAWRNVALLAAAVAICGGVLVWRAARSGGGRPSGPQRVAATPAAGGSAGVAADGGKEAGIAKEMPAAASLPDDLYVVPEGGDVPPGIPSAAVFRRIRDAVNVARPGSVIHLTKGIYRETIVFRKSGQPGRPITIEGETEAVLDPSSPDPADAEWTPASEVGNGVYKRALPERPGLLAWEGKYIPRIPPEAMEGDAFKAPGMGAELLAKAPLADPASGGPEAIWGWRGGFVYVRFADGRNPRGHGLAFSPDTPALTVESADHIAIRGLTVRSAVRGVVLTATSGSSLENCRFLACETAIVIGRDSTCCRVSENTISSASAQRTGAQPAERHPSPIPGCVAAGPAILLDGAGINNAVWGNEIEGGAKGVEVRGRGSEGLHLYSNRIRGIAGPGILLAGAGPRGEIRVYGNRIRLSRAGVEFDCPLRERILVFRNVLYENGRDFVVRGRTAALLLAYHNTCASPTGVEYAGDGQAAAEGVRFFNNIFGGEKFVETSGGADAKPGFFTDYNVIRDNAREIREKYGWEANGLLGADPKFEDPAKGNFWLRPDSPAVGRGINISLIEQGIPDTYEPLHPEARPDAGALPNRIARRDEEAFEFRLQEQPGR